MIAVPGRHAGRDDRGDHRRRGRDRHDQPQDDGRAASFRLPGKKVGDWVEFGGLLGRARDGGAPESSAAFVRRGGRIPAPAAGLNN